MHLQKSMVATADSILQSNSLSQSLWFATLNDRWVGIHPSSILHPPPPPCRHFVKFHHGGSSNVLSPMTLVSASLSLASLKSSLVSKAFGSSLQVFLTIFVSSCLSTLLPTANAKKVTPGTWEANCSALSTASLAWYESTRPSVKRRTRWGSSTPATQVAGPPAAADAEAPSPAADDPEEEEEEAMVLQALLRARAMFVPPFIRDMPLAKASKACEVIWPKPSSTLTSLLN
mmetsp:Transcript_14257/g.35932  ORF Transcript_14257/g.35932 Transcript_14257/m.35932 type:complete len:231 (+) Transcript_14257:968-1660(+)